MKGTLCRSGGAGAPPPWDPHGTDNFSPSDSADRIPATAKEGPVLTCALIERRGVNSSMQD